MQKEHRQTLDDGEPIKWNFSVDAFMSQTYDFSNDSLNALYQ